MILTDRFIELINTPSAALWASNCNQELEPEMVRLLGTKVEPDREHILFFLPLKYGEGLLHNFTHTDKLTFLLAIVLTNESYQLKGSYLSHRPCNSAEVEFQKEYMTGLSTAISEYQGLPGESAFNAYYHQPSVAVRMLVREAYEQTPKIGAGEKVL
ncbi:hypothetical protein [Telluribacter sp. SYSU D00476]|uniref:hypothetical protein n=1 Tax=Telluribacter sp. SYSU D00476 TaxID=2811430 RepID=UPI001FF5999B|nr:hypothetical protein [Telluribacter sp. SYSU D00476]